jgi:DNA-binding NarL/FixJ family response regulator
MIVSRSMPTRFACPPQSWQNRSAARPASPFRTPLLKSEPEDMKPLSRSERRVATLYAQGLMHSEIALQLGVSGSTVRNQIAAAYRKLGVNSKVALLHALSQDEG